jgi:hypothetical protein
MECFMQLRNKQSYLMNLIYLMINSEITDLKNEDHQRVLTDLYDRFMPDKSNTEAEKDLEQLIKDCINSRGVEVIEDIHRWAQLTK